MKRRMWALLARKFDWDAAGEVPVPVAHLTVRSKDGIFVKFKKR